jgi:hypothetical protein
VSIADIHLRWVVGVLPPVSGADPGAISGAALGYDAPEPGITAGHRRNEPPAGEGDCISVQQSIPIYCAAAGPGRASSVGPAGLRVPHLWRRLSALRSPPPCRPPGSAARVSRPGQPPGSAARVGRRGPSADGRARRAPRWPAGCGARQPGPFAGDRSRRPTVARRCRPWRSAGVSTGPGEQAGGWGPGRRRGGSPAPTVLCGTCRSAGSWVRAIGCGRCRPAGSVRSRRALAGGCPWRRPRCPTCSPAWGPITGALSGALLGREHPCRPLLAGHSPICHRGPGQPAYRYA